MKRRMRRRVSRRAGFTLMEVMLVLIIIAAIASLVVVNVLPQQERANIRAAKAQIGLLKGNLATYRFEVGQFPSKLEDLHTQPSDLVDATKWLQLLSSPVPNDPWGNPYEYKPSGETFDLRSIGPDKQSGTDDDITAG